MFGRVLILTEDVLPIDDPDGTWKEAVHRVQKNLIEAMNMVMKKEKMAPSKKMRKPGKKVAQRKYTAADEKYDRKNAYKPIKKNPDGIADAMNKSKIGYSKKPRVKPSKKTSSGF